MNQTVEPIQVEPTLKDMVKGIDLSRYQEKAKLVEELKRLENVDINENISSDSAEEDDDLISFKHKQIDNEDKE